MSEPFGDLERFRLPNQQIQPRSKTIYKRSKSPWNSPKIQGEFLKGPIPLDWLSCASKLSGKAALSVALAIWFEIGRRRSHEIKLTTAICNRFCLNRKAKYRGLLLLEEAGLVTVVREARKNPLVTVLMQSEPVQIEPVSGNVPGNTSKEHLESALPSR
jgi:hypothetical protein